MISDKLLQLAQKLEAITDDFAALKRDFTAWRWRPTLDAIEVALRLPIAALKGVAADIEAER